MTQLSPRVAEQPAPRAGLLRGNRAFRALCMSRAVSFIGDGVTLTALVLLVAPRDGATWVGMLLLANALPRFGGALAGALVDRIQTRRLLLICELASALVIAAIAVALPPLPILIPLVAAAGVLATIRNPAGRSLVPVLVSAADRAAANALLGLAQNLQLAIGPALGGLLAAGGGVRTALAVDAATFLASALLLTRLPAIAPARNPNSATGVWGDAAAGVRYVAANRYVRVLVLALFVVVAFAAVDNVALVVLISDDLGAGPAGYGLAASAFGTGMLLASLACTRFARGRSSAKLLIVAIAATGAGTLATGLAPALAVVMAAQLIAGAGNALENIGYDTIVQDIVPRPFLGRVLGILGTAAQLGAGLAYAAAGLMVNLAGARATFILAGVGTLAILPMLIHTLRPPSVCTGQPGCRQAGNHDVQHDVEDGHCCARSSHDGLPPVPCLGQG